MSALSAASTAAVEAGGEIIFIDQRLEILERPVGLGAGQRRRQVIDDHSRGAPLGLGAFARIIDDEGIELGQGAERDFGIAFGAESAVALPGSHSRLPCLPLWMTAWAPKLWRSQK